MKKCLICDCKAQKQTGFILICFLRRKALWNQPRLIHAAGVVEVAEQEGHAGEAAGLDEEEEALKEEFRKQLQARPARTLDRMIKTESL